MGHYTEANYGGMDYNRPCKLSMSNTSTTCTLLYVVTMWPDCRFRDRALHHIATLQGTNPLSAQEPILPQIEAAVQQGIEIPLNTAPAAAVLPPMAEQTNVAAGDAAAAASNINVIAHNSNGALKGNPPFIFNGNRQLSKKFLLAFQLWRMINKNNDTMKRPYSRVIASVLRSGPVRFFDPFWVRLRPGPV